MPDEPFTRTVVEVNCQAECGWEPRESFDGRRGERLARKAALTHLEHTGHPTTVKVCRIDFYENGI